MDYVLFGMGYGATLMLLGWALRTFGPERKYRNVDTEDIDRSVLKHRWIRFIQGLGGVVSIAGTALVGFTFIIMLVNPDDETGSVIALATWAFLTIAILIWCWFYVSSFGTAGIWSREEGYGFRKASTSRLTRSKEPAFTTSRVVPKPRITDRTTEPEIGPSFSEASEQNTLTPHTDESLTNEPNDVFDVSDPEIAQDADLATLESEAVQDEDSDPEYDFGDSTDTTVPSETGGRTEAIRRLRERQSRTGNSSK